MAINKYSRYIDSYWKEPGTNRFGLSKPKQLAQDTDCNLFTN